MCSLKLLTGPMRIPFLVLTPACVSTGVGTAYLQTSQINWLQILIVLLGALACHVCVNTFNEYFDFKSGLDDRTQRTPFSGGSGTLQSHPELEKKTLFLAFGSLAIVVIIGLYFIWLRGWMLLPIGVIGSLLLVTYTVWWVYNPVLCLTAPGLGFGILMVMGTHFSLTGSYSWISFVASLVPAFLVSDLLLLNQFPDVGADKSIGRRHFPVIIGRKASANIYGALLLMAHITILAAVILGLFPLFTLLALLMAVPSWKAYQGVKQNAENIPALLSSMGLNLFICLAMPVLLALGLFIG